MRKQFLVLIVFGLTWIQEDRSEVPLQGVIESDSENELLNGSTENGAAVDEVDEVEVPWNLLMFDHAGQGTDIKSIEFTISKRGKEYLSMIYGKTFNILDSSIVASDTETLDDAMHCFSYGSCLRLVVPSGTGGGWGGGGLVVGNVRFVTNKGEFTIGISQLGFTFSETEAEVHSLFFAPAGADLLRRMYFKKHGSDLPAVFVDALSGESFIDSRHRMAQQMSWRERE